MDEILIKVVGEPVLDWLMSTGMYWVIAAIIFYAIMKYIRF